MFAYCNNSPIVHRDDSGGALETVWDIISLCASVVEVCVNPTDVWAWVGLVGDVIDVAIPFAGGIGETVKLLKTTEKIAETADAIDDTYDAAKVIDKVEAMCFVEGTQVLTSTGNAPIESIQTGDYVWAWDENTGDVGLRKVVETYINETDELVHVHVNGEEIITTPSHPFYSPVRGWTDAVHLRAGDILVLVNGEYVVVEKVQHEILEAPIEVYNFQVEDYHTYYVTDTGVLVHNSCKHQSSEWTKIRKNYWKEQAANGGKDTWYKITDENIALMKKGNAPIGYDGERVVLHHVKGIANDMNSFVEIGAKAHREFHKTFGYHYFIDLYAL